MLHDIGARDDLRHMRLGRERAPLAIELDACCVTVGVWITAAKAGLSLPM